MNYNEHFSMIKFVLSLYFVPPTFHQPAKFLTEVLPTLCVYRGLETKRGEHVGEPRLVQ